MKPPLKPSTKLHIKLGYMWYFTTQICIIYHLLCVCFPLIFF